MFRVKIERGDANSQLLISSSLAGREGGEEAGQSFASGGGALDVRLDCGDVSEDESRRANDKKCRDTKPKDRGGHDL